MVDAGLLSGGAATVNLLVKDQDSFLTALAVLVALSVANVMGFLTSAQVAGQRRSAFELLETEIALRLSLEQA